MFGVGADQQIGQLYELMQAIRNPNSEGEGEGEGEGQGQAQ